MLPHRSGSGTPVICLHHLFTHAKDCLPARVARLLSLIGVELVVCEPIDAAGQQVTSGYHTLTARASLQSRRSTSADDLLSPKFSAALAQQRRQFLRAESRESLSRRSDSMVSDFSIPHAVGSPVKRSGSQQGFPDYPGTVPMTPKARDELGSQGLWSGSTGRTDITADATVQPSGSSFARS